MERESGKQIVHIDNCNIKHNIIMRSLKRHRQYHRTEKRSDDLLRAIKSAFFL